MPSRSALVVLLLVGLLALAGAAPNLLFVGPGGSDSANNCQATGSPCLTIAYALSLAIADPTTITLKAGLHSASNIVGPNNVSLSGETPGTATIDCGSPATPAFAFQVGNSGQATFNVNFTSFRIQNCNKAAIVANQGARVRITDMDFISNSNAGQYGGALNLVPAQQFSDFSVIITNSRFTLNSAQFGGAIAAVGYDIGSVSRAPANVQISGCTFATNTASQWGGAVYMFDPDRQGTTYGSGGLLKGSSIANSIFTGNSAGTNGGAVYIVPSSNGPPTQPASSLPDVRNNVFTSNTVGNCETQCASAFYINNQAAWQFYNNSFSNNVATGNVGSAMTIGALLLRLCAGCSLDTHTFMGNNATNSNSGSTSGVFGAGLAIFFPVDYNLTLAGTNVFTNNRNSGVFGRGAGIGNGGQGKPYGTFYSTTFSYNIAATEGGAMYVSPGSGGLTFPSTSFSFNSASIGGALYILGGTATFNFCTFDQNFLTTITSLSFGGAIYMSGTVASFNQPTFSGNSGYNGAALFADAFGSTSVTLTGGVFSTNRAAGKGGALYLGAQPGASLFGQASATITSTNFLYNSAGQGGGIYAASSFDLDIDGSQFIGNQADFTLAAAATAGGGMFLKGQGNATAAASAIASLHNVYMDLNVASGTYTAGAIRCEGADLTLNATTLQIQPCCSDRCIGCDTVCSQFFSSTGNITCPQKTCPPNVPPPTAAPLPPPGAVLTVGPTNTPAPDFTAPPPTTPVITFPPSGGSNKILGLKPVIFWVCVVAIPAAVLVAILVVSIVLGMRKSKNKGPKQQSRRSQNYRTTNL